jgi:uncharacterized membrane protein
MSKSKPIKEYLPALGLIFGAGAGAIFSEFCDFQIAYGLAIARREGF